MDELGQGSSKGRGTVRTWWAVFPSAIRWRRFLTFGFVAAMGVALTVVGGRRVAAAGHIAGAEPWDLIALVVGIVVVLITPLLVWRAMIVDLRDVERTLDDDWERVQVTLSMLGLDDQSSGRDDDTTEDR